MGKRAKFGLMCMLSYFVLWGILAGCEIKASSLQDGKNHHLTLVDRVHQYHTARIQRDFGVLYDLHWSGYRAAVDRTSFLARSSNVAIHGYVLEEEPVLDGDLATVVVLTEFTAMGFEFKGRREVQEWILEHGDWFLRREPPETGVISTPFGPYRPRQAPAE